MRYRKLGRTGLLVSELCLGTNMFGGAEDEFWKTYGGLDQTSANSVIAAAFEGGINFIDTADGYTNGQSEQIVGQAIKDLAIPRSSVVLCTKAGMQIGPGQNDGGGSRAHLINACDKSLQRMGVDYIDLYLMHMFDPATPLEESLRALDDLVRAGKVRYVGCSNFTSWEMMKALGISERERLARFEVNQVHWSMAAREIERELVPMANSEGVGILAWGPLLGGALTGKYKRGGGAEGGGRLGAGDLPGLIDADRLHDIVDVMREIGAAHGVTPAEIAIAFLLREKAATSILVGSTKPEQVKANLRASDLTLSAEEIDKLDKVSAFKPDYAAAMMKRTRAGRQALV